MQSQYEGQSMLEQAQLRCLSAMRKESVACRALYLVLCADTSAMVLAPICGLI